MARTQDIVVEFPGIVILHQKIPGHEVGRHQHDEHEFFLPLQGEIAVTHEGETVKAGSGRILYVPPKLDHSFASSAQGSGERVIWLIEDKLWKKHSRGRFAPSSMPINSLAKELVFYLLLHRQADGARYFTAALIETLNDSLMAARLEKREIAVEHMSGKVKDARVQRAMAVMAAGSFALPEVARRSGLSLRNFNRLFLRETGTTPKEFVILRRMDKAKQLLRTSRMTVTDVALEVGYGSVSKFIEAFKKHTGSLPSDFRGAGPG